MNLLYVLRKRHTAYYLTALGAPDILLVNMLPVLSGRSGSQLHCYGVACELWTELQRVEGEVHELYGEFNEAREVWEWEEL